MLLSDTSCGALHEKGTNNDKGRANEPPSFCQNNNEPYPQGTWAHQRDLSCICDVQMGMGNKRVCRCRCQT